MHGQFIMPDTDPEVIVLFVSGVPGAGKSTLGHELLGNPDNPRNDVLFAKEPVDRWRNVQKVDSKGDPLFGSVSFFDAVVGPVTPDLAPAQIGLAQVTASHIIEEYNRAKDHAKSTGHPVVLVVERHPDDGSLFVQARMNGFSPVALASYYLVMKAIAAQMHALMPGPKFRLYLRADAETCMARIVERARPGEEGYTKEYIQTLVDIHERAFTNTKEKGSVIAVDATQPVSVVKRKVTKLVDNLLVNVDGGVYE